MKSAFSSIRILLMIVRNPVSAIRSGANVAGVTAPSRSPTAVRNGMLWSAVSRVLGSHFSGSVDALLTAER